MTSVIQTVLDQYSTKKYFIEYDGFLSNHLSHGLIALDRLGCPAERLNRFISWYDTRLENPSVSEEKADESIDVLKGKRVSYYSILKHYEALLKENGNDLDTLIAAEFPKLSAGLVGSALHGMIHLGYGYSARSERLVLEGLAYLYHSNVPIVTSSPDEGTFGHGNVEILDILAAIAKDENLRQSMLDGMNKKRYVDLKVGAFQRKVAYLVTEQGDTLVPGVHSIKLPAKLFNPDGTLQIIHLAKTVVKWAITVYTLSEHKNDFFFLHGVTAAWSVLQIISLLSYEDAVNSIRHFLTVLVAVYLAQDSPSLTSPLVTGREISDDDWDALVKRAVDEDRDEHCYKLVQVCREMANDDNEAANLYMQAAETVLENKFRYGS